MRFFAGTILVLLLVSPLSSSIERMKLEPRDIAPVEVFSYLQRAALPSTPTIKQRDHITDNSGTKFNLVAKRDPTRSTSVYIDGEITGLDAKAGDDIFDQKFTAGVSLKPGETVSVDTDGVISQQSAQGNREAIEQPVRKKKGIERQKLSPVLPPDPGGIGSPLQKTPDIVMEELVNGVTVAPGEKVSFFSSGKITRQKIQVGQIKTSRSILPAGKGKTSDHDIFSEELSGGFTLMPGQKASVYENGSLKKHAGAEYAVSSRQQLPRETHKQELHVSDNTKGTPDIFSEELSGGFTLMPGQKASVYENGSLKKHARAEYAVSSRQQVPRETHKQELPVSDNEGFLNQKLNGRLTVQSGQVITIPADGDIIKLNQKGAFEAQGHSRIIENSPGFTGKGYHHTETILQSPQSNLAETYLPDEDLKYTLEFNPQIN